MNAVPQTVETEPQVPAAMTPMDMIAIAVQSDVSLQGSRCDALLLLRLCHQAHRSSSNIQ